MQEIDLRTGLVRYEWHSLDHVPLSASYMPAIPGSPTSPWDFFHINMIDPQGNGNILVDSRNTWAAYEVQEATGQIAWRLGGKQSSFAMGPGATPAWQHDAVLQPNGTITLFDNGATPKIHSQSRALVLALNPQSMTATLLGSFNHPAPALVAASQGDTEPLSDGPVIFALAPCHGMPLGWLANSEALMALTLGTLGLTAMLRWRDDGGFKWGAWSLAAFSLALAAGEYGLCCAGYVVAFALSTPKGTPRRWASVLLFALPAAGYLVARRLLGCGAVASGFYQDPFHDTSLFLSHVPWRLVALVLMGWFSQQATAAWRLVGDVSWPSVASLLAFLAVGGVVLVHVTRQLAPDARRTTWAFVAGSFLSLLPLLSVLPALRLLGVPMLGIAPVVGVVLDTAWFGRDTEARRGMDWLTAIAAVLLGFAHLIYSPAHAWLNARQIKSHAISFANRTAQLARRLEGRSSTDVIDILGFDDVLFYGFGLEALGVRDAHWNVLSHTDHVLCRRTDPSTIELVVGPEAGIYPAAYGDLYRSEAHPVAKGETFVMGRYFVTVIEADRFGPRKARFQFPTDLDDPRRVWVSESRPLDFVDVKMPKVGFGVPFDP